MNETIYEGDYQCQVSEGEDHCRKVATRCYREPFTPAAFLVLTCDEHNQEGYYTQDREAEKQLEIDKAREAKLYAEAA